MPTKTTLDYSRLIFAHKRAAVRLSQMTATAIRPTIKAAAAGIARMALDGASRADVFQALLSYERRFNARMKPQWKRIVQAGIEFEQNWLQPAGRVEQAFLGFEWHPDFFADLSVVMLANLNAWLTLRMARTWRQVSQALSMRLIVVLERAQRIIPQDRAGFIRRAMAKIEGIVGRTATMQTTAGWNFGGQQMRIELGVGFKIWLSILDDRTRPAGKLIGIYNHREPNGQVQRVGDPFIVSREMLLFPGDESLGATLGNLAGCRCFCLGVK